MAFAVEGLFKSYGAAAVLKGVDLAVEDGEIHALLGANGAGKSTLIKCLSGAVSPDAGRISVGDASYSTLTPREAREAGIAVVYQELSLALSLSAADNIFLGREQRWGPFVRRAKQKQVATELLRDLGAKVDVSSDLANVANADLQSIEIAKALAANPKVLILDEPTAALSEREAGRLAERLRQLRKLKLPVLYVTHRLSEVFALADRVTILRGGYPISRKTMWLQRLSAAMSNASFQASMSARMPRPSSPSETWSPPASVPYPSTFGLVRFLASSASSDQAARN
jgi:ribose transport system ATP-binding protein